MHEFETHAAIVIGTFPKSGFVVRKVDRAVFFYAPEPFAVVVIDKIVENILPRAVHHRKILRQSVTGKEPGESYLGFGLHPPMPVTVDMS